MKKLVKILAAVAFILTAALSVKPAMAYFTTHTQARGYKTLKLTDKTEIKEPDVKENTKHIVISNAGPQTCFVRARAYAPSAVDGYDLTYSTDTSTGTGGTWEKDGDWYVYSLPLAAGESTSELLVKIDNIPEDEDLEKFNIVVIYETVPAMYDEDGKPKADWSGKFGELTSVTEG